MRGRHPDAESKFKQPFKVLRFRSNGGGLALLRLSGLQALYPPSHSFVSWVTASRTPHTDTHHDFERAGRTIRTAAHNNRRGISDRAILEKTGRVLARAGMRAMKLLVLLVQDKDEDQKGSDKEIFAKS